MGVGLWGGRGLVGGRGMGSSSLISSESLTINASKLTTQYHTINTFPAILAGNVSATSTSILRCICYDSSYSLIVFSQQKTLEIIIMFIIV